MTPAAAAVVLLAACALPAPLAAQAAPGPLPPRIELGPVAGVAGTSPEVGALASLPIGNRLSIDIGASYLARVWRSPAFMLTQAQLRIPFRPHLRSRYSLLVGVTHIEPLDPREGDSPLWRQDGWDTYPHAGASLQWPLGRHVDLRADAQLIVQGGELIPVVPRAVAGIVWHR
jgi:hypothetical protein